MNKKRILAIVAHPDDEVLGCGGFFARHAREGESDLHVCFLSDGIGSRGDWSVKKRMEKEKQAHAASEVLGIKSTGWAATFLDNRFDEKRLLDVVNPVEKFIKYTDPHIILTHSRHDLNIDHRITFQAVLTATRPYSSNVKEIYSFEVPSSTEWNYPTKFSPNVFYSLNGVDVIKKETALEKYKDEIRESPHPRSIDFVWTNAEYWGSKCGVQYAEAFELVRMFK